MAIIALRAWYLAEYEPIREIENRPPDLRLSRNSLLKSGLRADFLDESHEVKQADWFQAYISGDSPEFYVEGSGTYTVANVDLISHEIYFTKQDSLAYLEPSIFFCYQLEYAESSDRLREELQQAIATLNKRSRIPLVLEESHRLSDGPARLNSSLMRKIRQSLLFIADATPILAIGESPTHLIPSPNVCVEVGYALQCKRTEQVLLAQMERSDMPGIFPFDLPGSNRLQFRNTSQLKALLSSTLEAQLDRFNLFR
ncbi:MAG: hypothetical protein WBA57_25885 [Elainellaceae cyanobacterium]